MSQTESNESKRSVSRLNRKTVTILVALTAAGVLSVAIVFQPPGFKERFLHLFGLRSEAETILTNEYVDFKRLVKWTCYFSQPRRFKDSPPETLHEFFVVDFSEEDDLFRRPLNVIFRYLSTGIDPWGTPFIYETKWLDREDELEEYRITVRSVGANQRDEQGAGDDLQCIVPVLFVD